MHVARALACLAIVFASPIASAQPAPDVEPAPQSVPEPAPQSAPEPAPHAEPAPQSAPEPAPHVEPEPPAPETVVGLSLGTGLRFNSVGAIDLAGLAGSTDYGEANDAGPFSLGLAITLGVIVDAWELMGEAAVNFGGLNLSGIEERYFDSEPEPIGGTSTAWLYGSVRRLFRLTPDVELAAGLGGGYLLMGASSPAGGGFYRAISVGPEAEIRYRVSGEGLGGGWFGLGLDGRLLVPVVAEVGSGDDAYFSLEGTGDVNWLAGLAVHYRYDWR